MALLLVAGTLLMAFVLRLDATARVRLLPSMPFSRRAPWGPGFVMVLALSTATISFTFYGPFIMETLFGATPFVAGAYIAAEAIAWSLAAIAFARAGAGLEPRLIRWGALLILAGIVGFAVTMPRGPLAAVLPCAILQGTGFGMAWAFVMRRIVASVDDADRERASSAVPTTQMVGYALGAALAGTVANMAGLAAGADHAAVGPTAFWIFAAFLPLAAIGAFAAWRLADREQPVAA
jgi:hypothetical protein